MAEGARFPAITVEGWRAIPHSYAMVAQWHCLSLLKRRDIRLQFADRPLYRPEWGRMRGVFDAETERRLAAIPAPSEPAVSTLRLAFPFDFRPAATGTTFVFATCETAVAPGQLVPPLAPDAIDLTRVRLVTPSDWSRRGFVRWGFPAEAIHVVPHGVSSRLFSPDRKRREAARKRLGLSGVVLLSLGAMTGNKGIDLLLRAFARLVRARADVKLLLKGADQLYGSQTFVTRALQDLAPADRAAVQSRLVYVGGIGSVAEVADLYQAADIYVAPYRAEGFCLPVLEAMASGLPVICTGGGPTDDFTSEACAARVASVEREEPGGGRSLEPDLDVLAEHLQRVVEDADWRRAAGAAGRKLAVERYGWDHVTQQLVDVLLPAAAPTAPSTPHPPAAPRR